MSRSGKKFVNTAPAVMQKAGNELNEPSGLAEVLASSHCLSKHRKGVFRNKEDSGVQKHIVRAHTQGMFFSQPMF